MTPVGLSLLAQSYADLDQPEDALRLVDEAKDVIEKTGKGGPRPMFIVLQAK
jgi:hypothetical protein